MAIDLEKYVDQRFRDLEEKMALMADGLNRAARDTTTSLDRLVVVVNDLRDQRYVTQDVFQAETKSHEATDERFHGAVDARLRAIETTMANHAGRFWALGIVVTAINTAIILAVKFWK